MLAQQVPKGEGDRRGRSFCSLVLFEVFFFVKDDVKLVSDFQLVVNADCLQLEPRPPKQKSKKKSRLELQTRKENHLLRTEIQPQIERGSWFLAKTVLHIHFKSKGGRREDGRGGKAAVFPSRSR